MKNILQNMDDAVAGKKPAAGTESKNEMKSILESLQSVGEGGYPMSPTAPMPQEDRGTPVSMNVSLNASGKEHVEDLINMMKNAGMGGAKEVEPMDMPAMPIRMDMERLRDIVDEPEMETIDEAADEDALRAWYEKYNKYQSADVKKLADGMFKMFMDSGVDLDAVEGNEYEKLVAKFGDEVEGDALSHLDKMPITGAMFDEFEKIMGEPASEESAEKAVAMLGLDEGYDNEPDEQYDDHETMINDLSGGINRKKKAYAAAQDGDNAMSVEASIKEQLLQALSKKKVGEEKQKGVDGKACWDGYKRMGTKKKGGKTVDNCVKMTAAEKNK